MSVDNKLYAQLLSLLLCNIDSHLDTIWFNCYAFDESKKQTKQNKRQCQCQCELQVSNKQQTKIIPKHIVFDINQSNWNQNNHMLSQ